MLVQRVVRVALMSILVLLTVAVAPVSATPRLTVGFFDDPSFRWAAKPNVNFKLAQSAHASVVHVLADWSQIAAEKPKFPLDGDDPAYQLTDLDALVRTASRYNLQVIVTISGTPKWANGGKSPNHMPKKLSDLTSFAHMLAARYNGASGHGSATLFSVWNEPNLGLFLTPQFSGKKNVGPANYAKLYKAAYAGIKAGDRLAQVAAGETSARGRDKPIKGVSDSVAPATFARLLAAQKGVKLDAWAHHPYPTTPSMKPLQKVRYPNVSLATLPQFEKDLRKWFHRVVPVWITEYGHETKPGEPRGVSSATQASYAKQALAIARKDPNVQMFIWFTFRDSAGNPWQSGLEVPSGAPKPSYSAFSSLSRLINGLAYTVKAGRQPTVKVYFPTLFYYQGTGGTAGMYWTVRDGATTAAAGTPVIPFNADQSLSIALSGFTPVKGHTYTLRVTANESGGHSEFESVTLKAA
jgi:hypothetical protein